MRSDVADMLLFCDKYLGDNGSGPSMAANDDC
jgi:hypothetical protein